MRIKYGYMGKSGEFVLLKNKIGSYGKRKKRKNDFNKLDYTW